MSAAAASLERLLEAIENGEFLNIRYFGGAQPGTVRVVWPLSTDGRTLRARDEYAKTPKTFHVGKIVLEDPAEPETYVGRKTTRIPVDIATFARDWAFSCPMPAFASALDIALTPSIRRDPKTGKRVTTRRYTQGAPPAYAFDIGDIFYWPRPDPDSEWGSHEILVALQVVEPPTSGTTPIRRQIFRRGSHSGRDTILKPPTVEFVALLRDGPSHELWAALSLPDDIRGKTAPTQT